MKEDDLRAIISMFLVALLMYLPLFDLLKEMFPEDARNTIYTTISSMGASIMTIYFAVRRGNSATPLVEGKRNVIRLILFLIVISGFIVGVVLYNMEIALEVVNWPFLGSSLVSILLWMWPGR